MHCGGCSLFYIFFFSSRRRHTRFDCDWSSNVCSSDLTLLLRHSLGEATLQANLASFPSVGFFGPPIFQGLFGPSSLVSIAFASTLSAVTMISLTPVLLEIQHQRTTPGGGQRGRSPDRKSVG